MCPAEIDAAISSIPVSDTATRCAVALQWYTAARVGDILHLRQKSINWAGLEPDDNNLVPLSVAISEGKVVRARGPYTIHTAIPLAYAQILDSHLSRLPAGDPEAQLFPTTLRAASFQTALIRNALKTAGNDKYNTRSIRRGALQTMARNNVPHDTLMVYSGHKSVDTLLRYLDWGRQSGENQEKGTTVAPILSGSSAERRV